MALPRWLTIAETAQQLGVSKSTVRRMIADDLLHAVTFRDRCVRVPADSLNTFTRHVGKFIEQPALYDDARIQSVLDEVVAERPPDQRDFWRECFDWVKVAAERYGWQAVHERLRAFNAESHLAFQDKHGWEPHD